MAGQRIMMGGKPVCIDYHDGEGSAVVNGRKWRWEFHEYGGPTFVRADGTPLKRQPPWEYHPVWAAFERCHKRYQTARTKAPASEIVYA